MAKVTFTELKEQGAPIEIANKYLMVKTERAGYNGKGGNIYKGNHPYRVVQQGGEGGEYAVYPTKWKDDHVLTNEEYPIIISIGEDVFFTNITIHDPYNHPITDKVTTDGTVEEKILEAFVAYTLTEFRFGGPTPYNSVILVDDEDYAHVEDGTGANLEVTYEHTNKYEPAEAPEGPTE